MSNTNKPTLPNCEPIRRAIHNGNYAGDACAPSAGYDLDDLLFAMSTGDTALKDWESKLDNVEWVAEDYGNAAAKMIAIELRFAATRFFN